MTNPDLLARWKITEDWLREAQLRLFISSEPGDVDLTNFTEYLSHNELELALYELAEAAKQSLQSHRFWDAMCQAAGLMSLNELRSEFAIAWAATKGV